MRKVSTITLGLMLALGTTAMVAEPAAAQKKEKPAKQKPASYSPAVRTALVEVQAALTANDTATAATKIAAAKAAVQNDDDRYAVGSLTYELGRKTSDNAKLLEGIDAMLASGKVNPADQANFYSSQGKIAYQLKDYPKAATALEQAMKLGSTDQDLLPVLVEAKHASGQTAAALTLLQEGIAQRTSANQPVPAEWYGRGISIALANKSSNPADTAAINSAGQKLTQQWVSAYPTRSNWRDTMIIYRDTNRVPADIELDVYRLMRTAGALKGEADYMDYVQAIYQRFPAEANAVLAEGIAAGMVKLSTSQTAREINDLTKSKLAADRASLAAAAKSANAAPTGRGALSTADAYLGYKEWATAIELYRVALAKGGVDANVVNIHLGQALAASGQKEEARKAFQAVTGPRAALAQYWLIFLDHPATA
jgi:tetratricopeptide (TPR) repeat protein